MLNAIFPIFFRIRNSVIASTVVEEYWDSKKYHVITGAAPEIPESLPEYVRSATKDNRKINTFISSMRLYV